MISEPELDGAWESARPAEVAQDDAVPARGPLRPWRWVAAAVAATSALWAGGLYAFGELPAAEPEVRYAVTDDLCGQFKAPALAGALGGFTISAPQKGGRDPALDWAACSHEGQQAAGWGGYSVSAMVELHRKSDPAPEFALGSQYDRIFGGEVQWEEMPGLGEQALVRSPAEGDGLQLRVRDGGAVFLFEVMFFDRLDAEAGPRAAPAARPDHGALTAAAVEDARALMAALRKG
ncbi:hypothetical protein [Streptomyces sp. A0592]|uniref:hypothetical protein n=1 Tax=Streptomyces sp. A0592 TaxID=2563099 RepID=UPI00109E867A|nr:hypothetical protein [Streptomyces sp. A0592]THA79855.1 hypothetical protein E6U81_31430 [Streptomyces sp. A0592]